MTCVLGGAAGCSVEDDPTAADVLEIERFTWIAPGETGLGFGLACGVVSPLLVERHEVTRGQWLDHVGTVPALYRTPWEEGSEDLPATGMDLEEARGFAAQRDLRLPTASEWLWIAGGPRGAPYPYGLIPKVSAVNSSEVGLGHCAPVGTFASGRTPTGVADTLGNVWEWTAAPVPPPARPYETPIGLPAWVMGGSYLTPARALHGGGAVFSREVEPAHRANDIGVRCVVEAEAWLRAHAGDFDDAGNRIRLLALGETWGRDAVPTLARLAQEPDAGPALAWLLEGARR